MKIRTKEVRTTAKVLDELVLKYKERHPEKERDWRTYEQRLAERMREAIHTLDPLFVEHSFPCPSLKSEKDAFHLVPYAMYIRDLRSISLKE